jgi:hypothetical protein
MQVQTVQTDAPQVNVSVSLVPEQSSVTHETAVTLPAYRASEIFEEYESSFAGIFVGSVLELTVTATLFACATYWCKINTSWLNEPSFVSVILCGVILYLAWQSTRAMGKIARRLLGAAKVD